MINYKMNSALIGGHLQLLWVYIIAPATGAITAVLAFLIMKEDSQKK
jgi:glycerol uptake facilitator-like aquaporin